MTVEEEIKEIKTLIAVGIVAGIVLFAMANGGSYAVLATIGFVSNFIYYDVLGNEDPFKNIPIQSPEPTPIDDCSFSEDRQLCYQMKRIADVMEDEN